MAKVFEVKFLRVEWTRTPSHESEAIQRTCGLDTAHSELATKISELLKLDYVMEGGVIYINPEKAGNYTGHAHLVQKMVRYETMPSLELGIRRK